MEKTFSSEEVVAALAEEILNNFDLLSNDPENEVGQIFENYGAAWFQAKAIQGVKRLSPADQRQFYAIAAEIMRKMPADVCADTMRGQISAMDSARAEVEAIAKMADETVATYLAIMRKSLIAEISDNPIALPLSLSEREIAERVYTNNLISLIDQHPRAQELIFASDLSDRAPDSDVCELSILSVEAGIEIKGQAGDWVIRMLSWQ